MPENPDNPIVPEPVMWSDAESRDSKRNARKTPAAILIFTGLATGVVGLALVSNQFGNTDTLGLAFVGLGGMLLCWGVCCLFMKVRYAFVAGIAAAPLSLVLLFVLYWVSVILAAVFRV